MRRTSILIGLLALGLVAGERFRPTPMEAGDGPLVVLAVFRQPTTGAKEIEQRATQIAGQ